jgi:hypothetical protein
MRMAEATAATEEDIAGLEGDIRSLAHEHALLCAALGRTQPCPERDEALRRLDVVVARLRELQDRRNRFYDGLHDVLDAERTAAAAEAAVAERAGRPPSPTPPPACPCTDIVVDTCTATIVCRNCGRARPYLDNTEAHVNYNDLPVRRHGGGYRPPNHFSEIVAQFQGKRRARAPPDVVRSVRTDCARYHIPPNGITAVVVRRFLKQRRRSDCYKFCAEVAATLSGIPPPYMTPMQEDRVAMLFPLTVQAYRTSPRYLRRRRNRNGRLKLEPNNMNYFYVFYKLCQMLGYDEFLPYIPLPKSAANIDDNDRNGWRHVCAANGWRYTPTR